MEDSSKSFQLPDGFALSSGGLIYGLTSYWRKSKHGVKITVTALVTCTWIPLGVLAIYYHTLNDTASTVSFFEDFQMHIKFLVVLPFLIAIEPYVDHIFVKYIGDTSELIDSDRMKDFGKLVTRIDRLTNSFLPEVLMLILIYVIAVLYWPSLSIFEDHRNYLSYPDGDLNGAGWFYLLVCSPIFQLFLYRWIWRWLIWVYSIVRVVILSIRTDPFHADYRGGLVYLNMVPFAFSVVMLSLSALYASAIATDVVYGGRDLLEFKFQILIYLVVLTGVIFSPLLFFIPVLLKAKVWGIEEFGKLLEEHDRLYVDKWIRKRDPEMNEPLLGSVDNSSLADINGSYAPVAGMNVFLIDYRLALSGLMLNSLIFIPLIFTHYTTMELLKDLIQKIIGS